MKTALCILAAAALLAGCHRQPQPTPPPAPSAMVRYEFNQFDFHESQRADWDSNTWMYCYLLEYTRTNGPQLVASNRVYDAGSVMDYLGRDGWDLAWTDGHRFLVKRPLPGDYGNPDYFMVEQGMERLPPKK